MATQKPTPEDHQRRPAAAARHEVLIGWGKFALFTVGSFALLYGLTQQVVTPFTRGIALLTKTVLTLIGVPAQVNGIVVATPAFAVAIQNNCNAIYETALFIAAVLAYPATWRERAVGTLLGGVTLYLVNLIRVLSLIYVGSHFRQYFDLSHVYLWQSVFIAFALGLWIFWAGKLVQSPRR